MNQLKKIKYVKRYFPLLLKEKTCVRGESQKFPMLGISARHWSVPLRKKSKCLHTHDTSFWQTFLPQTAVWVVSPNSLRIFTREYNRTTMDLKQ